MPSSAHVFLAVGAGVLAPTLLTEAAKAGIAIKPFVTAGHKRAIASLTPPILGVAVNPKNPADLALIRYNDIQVTMVPLRGSAGKWNRADLDAGDLDELLTRFLAAAKAGGYRATVPATELPWAGMDAAMEASAWEDILSGERPAPGPSNRTLTTLGELALACGIEKAMWRVQLDPLRTGDAIGKLALEMDELGYLITGAPPSSPTITGGLGAAASAVVDFVTSIPEKLGDTAANALLSKLGLMLLAGVIVWKVVKA